MAAKEPPTIESNEQTPKHQPAGHARIATPLGGQDTDVGELLLSTPDNNRKHKDDSEVELTREVFDVIGADRAAEWMHTEAPSLQNRRPLSLMGTAEGREEVERVLGRIEHEIF